MPRACRALRSLALLLADAKQRAQKETKEKQKDLLEDLDRQTEAASPESEL